MGTTAARVVEAMAEAGMRAGPRPGRRSSTPAFGGPRVAQHPARRGRPLYLVAEEGMRRLRDLLLDAKIRARNVGWRKIEIANWTKITVGGWEVFSSPAARVNRLPSQYTSYLQVRDRTVLYCT